jgi:hypothetical protein
MSAGIEKRVSIKTVEIEIPLMGGESPGYKSRNVNFRFDPNQLDALYRMFHALNLNHEKLINGKTVATPYHAVQWMLERLSERVTKENPRQTKKPVSRSAATSQDEMDLL